MTRAPDPIDIHVGARLRLARKACGLTQNEVARTLRISAQQFQKYETGASRLAAGRLFRLAGYFDVSITFFFDDMPPQLRRAAYEVPNPSLQAPGQLAGLREGGESWNREVLRLVAAFLGIPDAKLRGELVSFLTGLRRSFKSEPCSGSEG